MALLLNAGDTVSRSYSYAQPSPLHPSMPQGTGERTENLYNINAQDINNGYVDSAQLYQDGTIESYTVCEVTEYIELIPNASYRLSNIGSFNSLSYCIYDSDKQYITGAKYSGQTVKAINMPPNGKYLRFSHYKLRTDTMLNLGSTALPYEPYGYKIPISSANTTTPVYLGEVETTRKIKKLVLTGEENWRYSTSSQAHWIENVPNDYDNTLSSQITTVCTHYKCIRNDTGIAGMNNGDLRLYAKATSPVAHELYIKDETYISAAEFKSYLAAQYAAGTPVTLWYVLATPETAVVNEPLMKIGDYADEVSGITIPVTAGANTITVDTTVQPSEFTATWTGWHDANVKEWDGSQWNE